MTSKKYKGNTFIKVLQTGGKDISKSRFWGNFFKKMVVDEIFINLSETGQISTLKQTGQDGHKTTHNSHIIVKFKNSKDEEKIL